LEIGLEKSGVILNELLPAVRHAVTILCPDVIKTLIFDKGYWDGRSLSK
jgi:hypothetical protein